MWPLDDCLDETHAVLLHAVKVPGLVLEMLSMEIRNHKLSFELSTTTEEWKLWKSFQDSGLAKATQDLLNCTCPVLVLETDKQLFGKFDDFLQPFVNQLEDPSNNEHTNLVAVERQPRPCNPQACKRESSLLGEASPFTALLNAATQVSDCIAKVRHAERRCPNLVCTHSTVISQPPQLPQHPQPPVVQEQPPPPFADLVEAEEERPLHLLTPPVILQQQALLVPSPPPVLKQLVPPPLLQPGPPSVNEDHVQQQQPPMPTNVVVVQQEQQPPLPLPPAVVLVPIAHQQAPPPTSPDNLVDDFDLFVTANDEGEEHVRQHGIRNDDADVTVGKVTRHLTVNRVKEGKVYIHCPLCTHPARCFLVSDALTKKGYKMEEPPASVSLAAGGQFIDLQFNTNNTDKEQYKLLTALKDTSGYRKLRRHLSNEHKHATQEQLPPLLKRVYQSHDGAATLGNGKYDTAFYKRAKLQRMKQTHQL
jgi:hypothetical protein